MSDIEFDPVPAHGEGSEFFDQPVLFFLTHQEQIEQWAMLSLAAAEAAHQWLTTTVSAKLAELAAQRDMQLHPVVGPNRWHHLLLAPLDTPTIGDEPVIGIALCWHPQKINPKTYLPFVGVRVAPLDEATGPAFLAAGGLQVREEQRLKGKGDRTWPAYFYLAPFDRWWASLDAYLAVIVEQVTIGLDHLEAPVRAAVQAVRTS